MKCEVCGKEYKSMSGLRRHVKSVHGDKPAGEVGRNDQASQARVTVAGRSDPLVEACKALGIKRDDVMSHAIYEDKVVIIEGPTGWKRVWLRK